VKISVSRVIYSRRLPLIAGIFSLLITAGGILGAVLIWKEVSGETRLLPEAESFRERASWILENAELAARPWEEPALLPADPDDLSLEQQRCLAICSAQKEMLETLVLQLEGMETAEAAESLSDLLSSVSEVVEELEKLLEEAGNLLSGLEGLQEADSCYTAALEALNEAVRAHNSALQTTPPDFSGAKAGVNSALSLLQQAEDAPSSVPEGLDPASALSAVNDARGTARLLLSAFSEGETGHTESHDTLSEQASQALGELPCSLSALLGLPSWIHARLQESLLRFREKVEAARKR
jgi:hypothetical protein